MKSLSQRSFRSLSGLRRNMVECRKCPRLVRFREGVPARASFRDQTYWRKPVPGFGDPDAWLVVVGLAPAAHGGNRTGRVFSGDSSGRFLVRALHAAGFANQPISESRDDGLLYTGCYVTAAVRCAPPGDRPTPEEFANCAPYLEAEFKLLKGVKAVLALGGAAFRSVLGAEKRNGSKVSGMKFAHGAVFPLSGGRALYASYHPSPRNTNTGKLTQAMLVEVLERIREGAGERKAR